MVTLLCCWPKNSAAPVVKRVGGSTGELPFSSELIDGSSSDGWPHECCRLSKCRLAALLLLN